MHQLRPSASYTSLLPALMAQAVCRPANAAHRQRTRGSALITAIVFALVVALTLAGVSLLTVSHYSLAHVEASSTAALDLAEAGINYELTKLTNNVADADQPSSAYRSASDIDASLTSGTFQVYCEDPNTKGTWDPKVSKKVLITCTALINGARRTVQIAAQPSGTFYTVYGAGTANKGGQTAFNGSGDVIDGIVGTDGKVYVNPDVTPRPTVQKVIFNGPNSGWYNNQDPGGYTAITNAKTVAWQSVAQKISSNFEGGESALAQNNDNAMATFDDGTPAADGNGLTTNGSIPGHQVITLHSKPPLNGVVQPTNYYLTVLQVNQAGSIKFDNTKGPIDIYYVAPKTSSGAGAAIRGGESAVSPLLTPGHNVNLYSSATGSLLMTPDGTKAPDGTQVPVEMGIYAYDTVEQSSGTQAFGSVTLQDNLNFKGQIIANKVNISNNVHITGQTGYFETPDEYYAFSGNWQELSSSGSNGGANQ